jgi:hypothetical protein
MTSKSLREADFSGLHFATAISLIVACVAAYPVWQAIQNGGYIFYTNGVDESSYLSYPFALEQAHRGLLRPTSWLVVALHQLGLGGGYINLLLDVTITPLIIIGFYRVFMRLSFSQSSARRAALLAFALPLLLTPMNPLIEHLLSVVADTSLSTWILITPRAELTLLRSPEPQLSLAATLWLLSILPMNGRALVILLSLSPGLYSFIRTPYLVTCFAMIGAARFPLTARAVLSLLMTSAAVAIFWWYSDTSALERFTVTSRLPLVPLSGVVCLPVYAALRQHLSHQHRIVWSALILALFLAPNLHLITGWFIGPLKYEEYWGVVVFGALAATTIEQTFYRKNLSVIVGLSLVLLQGYVSFEFNRSVFTKLSNPKQIVDQLSHSAASLAINDIYLASHLDLMHPKQPATLLSFNKTYDLITSTDFNSYLCAKQAIKESYPQETVDSFAEIFHILDWGYRLRGLDVGFTLGRQPLEHWQPVGGQIPPAPRCNEQPQPILFIAR